MELVSVSAPVVAMRNDDVVIEAQIQAFQCTGETCVVELLQDGQTIDFRNVFIESESVSRRVRFDQRVSEVGTAAFQTAIAPLDGETTTENNFDEIEINVTRSDIKVLLSDELPRWEYRYLAQLFRRDAKVELDELLFQPRMIATGRRQETSSFPTTIQQWDQYDVVILGDLSTQLFPAVSQESLIEYLRQRGGTVIMIAGTNAMPDAYADHALGSVIPVRPIQQHSGQQQASRQQALVNGYALRVTDAGRDHIALMIGKTDQSTRDAWDFINRFSPLYQVSPWRSPVPTARSLIDVVPRDTERLDVNLPISETASLETGSSFLCWQPVGRGRVIYVSAPDTFRLRFLRGDRLHYRFWGQLMRWAIASDLGAGNQTGANENSQVCLRTKSNG